MRLDPHRAKFLAAQPGAMGSAQVGATSFPGQQNLIPRTRTEGQFQQAVLREHSADELQATLERARGASFRDGRLARGARLDATALHASARTPGEGEAPGQRPAGRGSPSAAASLKSMNDAHPLYGRYLQAWQGRTETGAGGPLEFFQERLRELKQAVRSSR